MKMFPDFPEPVMIPVNGVLLEVFDAGGHNYGKPIVLCHGSPEHAFSWRHQIPALVEAGYHVIVPNQRGFGNSSRPEEVEEYDIAHLTGDLAALLDHYGYEDAVFAGHDWGAMVVWWMSLLHPQRIRRLICLSVPYQIRGERPWIEFMEEYFGADYYFVHFNRQPGVADRVLDENCERFLDNLYRKNIPQQLPGPGMEMINLALSENPPGDPLLNHEELELYRKAFVHSGFSGGINWYRNLDRNWHILAEVDPIIRRPALMIYGDHDTIPKAEYLPSFVPDLQVVNLDCGHWIQQEKPEETNEAMITWLKSRDKP